MDRSTQRSFSFVNLKHPDDLKDEETQLRIRRLAMTEVGKARRKPKSKRERNELVLEFKKPPENSPGISYLGGGKLNPFEIYPVELTDLDRTLIASIFDHTSNHTDHLRGAWWPVGLSSAPAFYNMLANAQNFIFQKHSGFFPSQDNAMALSYHHKALKHASEITRDPKKADSDEVLSAVTSFMCHQDLLCSFTGGEWQKHRNALLRLLDLRGGFANIADQNLCITLTWGDLMGSYYQDIPPLVPMPRKWVANAKSPQNSPRPLSSMSLLWKQQLTKQHGWINIFDDIVQLISLDRAFSQEQQALAITSGCWLEPTIYRLLKLRPLHEGNNRENLIEEICRLGTLLFLAPFWKMMGQGPVWTAALSRNLSLVLTRNMVEWNELKPFLLWVLYVSAVETADLAERSQFAFMLAVLVSGMQLQHWDEVMQVIKSVVWTEKVFGGADELIRDEVMQIVQQKTVAMRYAGTPPTQLDLSFGQIVD